MEIYICLTKIMYKLQESNKRRHHQATFEKKVPGALNRENSCCEYKLVLDATFAYILQDHKELYIFHLCLSRCFFVLLLETAR